MTVHEVLIEVRHRLKRHGWFQGNYSDPRHIPTCETPMCISGHVHWVITGKVTSPELEEDRDLVEEVVSRLSLAISEDGVHNKAWGWSGLVGWNDAHYRTLADVLAVVDRAIEATAPEPTPEPELVGVA